ncbi:hypothetical protein ACP70R_041414 [Stipagrostis hirtigluma subsp. patula]
MVRPGFMLDLEMRIGPSLWGDDAHADHRRQENDTNLVYIRCAVHLVSTLNTCAKPNNDAHKMPRQITEEQDGREVRVTDTSPAGDAAPAVPKISAFGKCGVPVLIAPFQGQRAAGGGATAQEMAMAFQGILLLQDDDDPDSQRKKWFKEMRGWLMVLATVAASVTYQAGLNPPGGFWQDDSDDRSHRAGDPVLRDEHWSRYMIFYYFNATAFVTSLVIMVLLMSERFYHTEAKVVALMLTTFVDLASLVGAYIAGTTRYFSSCIYVIVITCVAFVGVILIGEYADGRYLQVHHENVSLHGPAGEQQVVPSAGGVGGGQRTEDAGRQEDGGGQPRCLQSMLRAAARGSLNGHGRRPEGEPEGKKP